MSTLSEEGVMEVKQTACDRLLSSRVEMKMKVRRSLQHECCARWACCVSVGLMVCLTSSVSFIKGL